VAIFDFKCPECGDVLEDVMLSCMHEDDEHPACYTCGEFMNHYITKAPWGYVTDTEFPVPFKAGAKGEIITGAKQRREFMARNDLLDANEVMTPPTKNEEAIAHKKISKSIADITPTAKQKEELKSVGIGDIVN